MTTQEAIKAMENGHMVREKNWHPDISGVFMQVPSEIPKEVIPKMSSLPQKVKDLLVKSNIEAIVYHSQIAMVHHGYYITGYHLSTADLLNGEWEIVEELTFEEE